MSKGSKHPRSGFARRFLLPVLALAAACMSSPAGAQDYRFRVPNMTVEVTPTDEGGAVIEYWIEFVNQPDADAIDIVDVGMPNITYDMDSMSADVDGVSCYTFSPSSYIDCGVEVPLGMEEIAPGQSGVFHFEGAVTALVFPDTEGDNYASIEFAPTWFDGDVVVGTTDITTRLILPEGTNRDNVRYHEVPFDDAEVLGGRVIYTWYTPGFTLNSQPPKVGASFPAELVSVVHDPSVIPDPAAEDRKVKIIAFGVLGGCFLVIFLAVAVSIISGNRRKMRYFPPQAKLETAGVRRGLSPVEAAIVCELLLGQVVSMIAFGLMKRGCIRLERSEPPRFQQLIPPPGTAFLAYEEEFLKCLNPKGDLNERTLREMLQDLVTQVAERMRGYHRGKTREYYEDQVMRAWSQVHNSTDARDMSERLTEYLEWLVMDPRFDDRMNDALEGRDVAPPRWWPYFEPDYWEPEYESQPPVFTTGWYPHHSGVFGPTFAQRMQYFQQTAVADSAELTHQVTAKTNPVPVGTGGGRSSGGGCACACACAGCACACAGGGR